MSFLSHIYLYLKEDISCSSLIGNVPTWMLYIVTIDRTYISIYVVYKLKAVICPFRSSCVWTMLNINPLKVCWLNNVYEMKQLKNIFLLSQINGVKC